jgi:GNAT superfamily N-acetyltransferase
MDDLHFRPATRLDVGFLVKAVRAAERVPVGEDDACIYETVFGFTHDEVDRFLTESLSEEGDGSPLTFRTFFVLEAGGRPVACCSAWVEAAGGAPSGRITAMMISRFLGSARWRECMPAVRALADSVPPRTPGAAQLESFYTDPEYRRRGATHHLIEGALRALATGSAAPGIAEINLLRENEAAARAYAKSGFEVVSSTAPTNALLERLTGSRGFIQMRRSLD